MVFSGFSGFSVLKFTLEDVNNISVISRRPVLLMEETREPGENHQKILVTVTQSITNVPQTNNTSTSGMNEE
jgi:hypothetical protein